MRSDVIVVGGGLGGLVAANLAADAGLSVTVLEGSAQLGGRAQTKVEQGFHLNLGPHAVYRGGAAERTLRQLGAPLHGRTPGAKGVFAGASRKLAALSPPSA